MNYDEIFQDNNFFRNVSEHEEEEEEFRFQEALRALAPKYDFFRDGMTLCYGENLQT